MAKRAKMGRLAPLTALLGACAGEAPPTDSNSLPYPEMAARIVAALQPSAGERAILRYDPDALPGFVAVVEERLQGRGVEVEVMEYGPVPDFEARIGAADIYVWLPAETLSPPPPPPFLPDQIEALGRWLDAGRGRQIHFHWGAGTMGADGVAGVHSAAYDTIYVEALDIDYAELDRRQEDAISALRAGEVRVTTAAGTDIRFQIGERPFNKQNGDATSSRMSSARIHIDREIELPAGVVRVAPIEESVEGRIVIPSARFADVEARNLQLDFSAGRISAVRASNGESEVRAALAESPALGHFREFALGFNPKLVAPAASDWIPYYGYGTGVVRLSLGNNSELGGTVRGDGVRWFFFTDATVSVSDRLIVDRGRLSSPE